MSFGQTPIYNPPVPFTTSFHNGLCDGAMVIINGTVLPSGDRFSVNFQCGGSSNDDIALHFNPRFLDGGYVVCNSKERNSWGKEENKREMPFHKGQPFELKILIKCNSYMVSVNGNHFMEFCHRIPLNRVNTMAVDGSVGLTCVNVQAQGAAFPSPQFPPGPGYNPAFPQPGFPSHQPGFPQPGFPSHQPGFPQPQPGFPSHQPGFPQPQPGFPSHQPGFPPQQFPPGSAYNPNQFAPAPMQSSNYVMPYQTPIYGGLFASKAIIVSGTVAANPKRFHINLKYSGGTAFHFNPRFDENTIVRNSFLNNSWGKEERNMPSCGMGFAPGQGFVIQITCEHHAFKVKVNGHDLCDFHHRMKHLQQIDSLQIEGDVVLQNVQL